MDFDISFGIKKNNKFITIKKNNVKSNHVLIKEKNKLFFDFSNIEIPLSEENEPFDNQKMDANMVELMSIQPIIDLTNIEINSLSNNSDNYINNYNYNMDDISFNEKEDNNKIIQTIKILKKSMHKELIKYIKKKKAVNTSKLKNIQTSIDFANIEIDSLSNKSDDYINEYKMDDISFNEKEADTINKLIKMSKKLKKSIHSELKQYFRKKKLDVVFDLKNIYNNIQISKYDNLILCYDNSLQINKDCNLLVLDIKNEKMLLNYFANDIFNSNIIDSLKLNELDNSYKTIKSIAQYLKFSVILLDNNLELIDELYLKQRKKLYFVLFNNNIYALDNSYDIFYKFKTQVLTSIQSCLLRDKEKNSSLVLFNELDNYHDYYIYFPKLKYSTFKYQYLLDNLYLKQIRHLTNEQRNILKYIVQYFGLHFYLLSDILLVNKNDLTLEYINSHSDYNVDNISLFDYNYYNKSKNNIDLVQNDDYKTYTDFDYYYIHNNDIIKGIAKQEIYDKCFNKYNIQINLDEIKKNYSNINLKNIKSQTEIDTILSLFPNVDNLVIFNSFNKKILSIDKMNFDNPPTFEYIYKLAEKIKECNICNCKLSINRKNDSYVSIDAVNPLLGHTINNNNIDLLCGKCNIIKGTSFMGNYNEKPYFYNINELQRDKLIEILKYHKLSTSGIIPILRKRLEKYITLNK
jgi:hypothetical protein